jgi:hypothetical protein
MTTEASKRAKESMDDPLRCIVESGLCSASVWSLNRNSHTQYKPPAEVVLHGKQAVMTTSSIIRSKKIQKLTVAGPMGSILSSLLTVPTVIFHCAGVVDGVWPYKKECDYPGPFSGDISSFAHTVEDCTYDEGKASALPGLNLMTGLRCLTLDTCRGDLRSVDFSHLTQLTTLKLENCMSVPAMKSFVNLKELHIAEFTNEIFNDDDLDSLVNLTELSITGGHDDTVLPQLGSLVNLTKLKIESYSDDDVLELNNLIKLTELHVICEGVAVLPELSSLVHLKKFSFYSGSASVLPDLSSLINLIDLQVDCRDLEVLPELSSLVNLTHLEVKCSSIKTLPELSSLINLIDLKVECSSIKVLPELSSLVNLTHLRVECGSIKKLPELNILVNLTHLRVACGSIKKLPKLNNLVHLTELSVVCQAVQIVPKLNNLVNLTVLSLQCSAAKVLPDLSSLVKLKQLIVKNHVDAVHRVRLPGLKVTWLLTKTF